MARKTGRAVGSKRAGGSKQDFASRAYAVVRRCPRGKVVSYGGVAAILGHPRAARGVGHALKGLEPGTDVPWWRVVNSRGMISLRGGPGHLLQRKLLEREGVKFVRDKIDWKRYGWDGL